MKLAELKKEYSKYEKKYSLPSFKQLNESFGVERAANKETDLPLRAIRRNLVEHAINFLQFLEGLLNPNLASMASLGLLKNLTDKEKQLISNCYEKLFDIELKSLALETEYNEKAEAEFIKESVKIWKSVSTELKSLLAASERAWKKKMQEEKGSYFG